MSISTNMFEYKAGDNVALLEGGSVKIKKELGRGGQGIGEAGRR